MTGNEAIGSWRGAYLGVELLWSRLPASIDAADLELLSEAERGRAAAFRASRRWLEYVGARVQLRRTLGVILRVAPGTVAIGIDEFGKPQPLVGGTQFNLSHSAGALLIGWGSRPLGVDLEAAARQPRHIGRLRIIKEVCGAVAMNPIAAFTLVEATAKALGRGLGALRGLHLAGVVGSGEFQFVTQSGASIHATRVPVPHTYVGAVAVLD